MSSYKDRGIIKWAPFDGLAGFNDLFMSLRHNLLKSKMPILSEDKLYELDVNLKQAIASNCDVMVLYYDDGYTKELFGKVSRVDLNNRLITVSYVTIAFDAVINLELDREDIVE